MYPGVEAGGLLDGRCRDGIALASNNEETNDSEEHCSADTFNGLSTVRIITWGNISTI